MKHRVIIAKMLAHAEKARDYCAALDYAGFAENDLVTEACVFNLGQIGELAGNTEEAFRAGHAEIPWRQIRGLRNRIVHDYEGVNRLLIWEIIKDDIPKLIADLKALLAEFSDNDTV